MSTTEAASSPKKRKPRRSFGAVRTLPSGSVQASYRHEGKQYCRTFPPKTKEKIINDWLAVQQADIARDRWVDPDAGSEIFRDYAETWLAAGVRQKRIQATTEAKYRGLLDRHLLPTFGNLQLRKIRPGEVQDWYDELFAQKPPTAAGAYRLLATIFNKFVKANRGFASPCEIEGGSTYTAKKRSSVNMVEAQAALDSISDGDKWFRCAVTLASWAQLRRSEVLGLQRGDIDLESGTVKIERAWKLTATGKLYMGKPKSDAGTRTLHLSANAQVALEEHLRNFVGPNKTAWLFPGDNGEPRNPQTFTYLWNKARGAIGRPEITYHDLRGSGLTWAAQNGATNAELMHRGGHANVASVMIYQRAEEERDKTLAERLNFTPGDSDPQPPNLSVVSG
jgi:integrase